MSWFMVGAAVVTAFGAIKQGEQASAAAKSQANMDDYNAQMAAIQARQANAATGRQEDEQRKQARKAIGMQLASSAEAGAGLNGDLLRQSIFDSEADTSAIRYEGELKAQGLYDQAEIARSSASASRSAASQASASGYLNAGASLLNAGASYGRYSKGLAAQKAK